MEGDAFALAGLGGFNAHGAGFLAAAHKHDWIPDLVTATSGQLLVVSDWLLGHDLKKALVDPGRDANPLAQIQTAFFGYPGVFRPAYREALRRLSTFPAPTESLVDIVADRALPAQQYVSARPSSFFEELALTFNERAQIGGKQIGVLFNAYDLSRGRSVLYGNKRAQDLLPKKSALPRKAASQDVRYMRGGSLETEVLPITSEAIQAALWLSLYGFDQLPRGQMDGAYHRSCIVSELHKFARIFVARPLANGWLGPRPSNWFQVQDWQCEMWFSVGYKAEVDALKRINDLIDQGLINDPEFRSVELHEIEPGTPAGYFNYFVERDAVFDRAFALSDELFTSLAERRNRPAK